MAVRYDLVNMMTNNPAKFERNPITGFRGVASTRSSIV